MTDTMRVEGVDLRTLPKVALHDHLDGGLRPATILELADTVGVAVPATTPEALARWFTERSHSGSLVEYLTTFDLTCAVMQTEAGLERVAREAMLDLAADGVIYAELRWAPEQHLTAGLTLDAVVEAVQSGIEAGQREAEAAGHEIEAGQIVSAMRHCDRALEIAELAMRHRERGVVGFDIAGPEAGFPPSQHRAAFELLADAFFPVTVHAGEADGIESIRGALRDGHALRLGHGVRLIEDLEIVGAFDSDDDRELLAIPGLVAQWVREREIALECSPTSNLQTGAFAAQGDRMKDHPFDLFYSLGFTVTVNCDNRLQSGTSLSRELAVLAEAFEYGIDDFQTFQLNAASAAFCDLDTRVDLITRIEAGFEGE